MRKVQETTSHRKICYKLLKETVYFKNSCGRYLFQQLQKPSLSDNTNLYYLRLSKETPDNSVYCISVVGKSQCAPQIPTYQC